MGFLRRIAWVAAFCSGLVAIFAGQAWVWWQGAPQARGTDTNALWARHQWVGEPHTETQYRALAVLLRQNRISDVFFHAGPLAADGSLPGDRYPHAAELIAAMHRLAPGVRLQAYLGQVRKVGRSGVLDLDDRAVRGRIVAADAALLDLGFDGIHYDIEPVYPDDRGFLGLLDQTRRLTEQRGRLLSASLEHLTLVDAFQPIYRALLPKDVELPGGSLRAYPPRPTRAYVSEVADRVDQLAIMTYDTYLPTKSLVGRHFAWQTERVLRLVGDRVTVFMGVPVYRTDAYWAEDLPTALRGVRKGIDALDRPPRRPYGVAVYPEWTATPQDWARYRRLWPAPG